MVDVTYADGTGETITIHGEDAKLSPLEQYLQVVDSEDDRQIDIPTSRIITVERDLSEQDDDTWAASAQYV